MARGLVFMNYPLRHHPINDWNSLTVSSLSSVFILGLDGPDDLLDIGAQYRAPTRVASATLFRLPCAFCGRRCICQCLSSHNNKKMNMLFSSQFVNGRAYQTALERH